MITAVGILCGLLAAGCGSSDSPPPAYVAAGEAICGEQLTQLNRLTRPSTLGQTVAYLPRVLAIMQAETGRLAALDPPSHGKDQLDAALTDTRALAALLRRSLHQLRAGMVEFTALSTLQSQSNTLRAQIDAHFRQAGLARCAE
ncbi:MAG TPA: hypothetical protein VK252_08005 [Solirubrobacteraceae bacterium]|nr:hypothetical protein [Solirubrobacteraceae bacterium]